jgi:predicted metal-dependent peptidase
MTMDARLRLYVNLEWVETASVPAIAGRLAHLLWHALASHGERARSVGVRGDTRAAWHESADASLWSLFERRDPIPVDLVDPASRRLPGGRSAEEYFAILTRLPVTEDDLEAGNSPSMRPDPTCGSCSDGASRSYESREEDVPDGCSEFELEHVREQVVIAYAHHVATRGTEPAELLRVIQRLRPPVIPWEQVLAGAVRGAVAWTRGSRDFTFSRRSRRQSAVPAAILAGMHSPIPRIAIVVDTSGSVDDELLTQAVSEVDGALRAAGIGGSSVSVLSCDAAVHAAQSIRHADMLRIVGGGGTDMRVGVAQALSQRPRPTLVVVLTDGYTPWPEKRPQGCTIVVGLLGRRRGELPPTPSWLQRIECVVGS